MAVLLRALCLLPLFLHVGSGQFLPFLGGWFGGNNNRDDVTVIDPDSGSGSVSELGLGLGSNLDSDSDLELGPESVSGSGSGNIGGFKGAWELVSKDSGVSSMHLILMPRTNKAIMFDATVFGPSKIKLSEAQTCRPNPDSKTKENDCWAHAVEYDIDNAQIRPLKVVTNPWCSSGALAVDGTLVGTGGWKEGGRSVRLLSRCPTCDWNDIPNTLAGYRWYATQQILPDGRFFVVGGRRVFSYEFLSPQGTPDGKAFTFNFLRETTDLAENNLYPFVHLSPDGNLFIFANNRSILLDPKTQKIVRELPALPGGSRNYPASGMSALLPLNLADGADSVRAEVIVCGGAKSEAFNLAEKKTFLPALQDCARIEITNPKAQWKTEMMPSRRVMGDMLVLPTGDLLMLNGAQQGTSAWEAADIPNLTPVLYSPGKPMGQRFTVLNPTKIPRMYHSSSGVLPDGKILVAGSNTNSKYFFTGVKFPTEMRVEKFSPPYLDPALRGYEPEILEDDSETTLSYGGSFTVKIQFSNDVDVDTTDMMVTMYPPPFTTHGYSMGQRLLILKPQVSREFRGSYDIVATAPPSGRIAPPGYYLLYVVHRGVPSVGMWVHIK